MVLPVASSTTSITSRTLSFVGSVRGSSWVTRRKVWAGSRKETDRYPRRPGWSGSRPKCNVYSGRGLSHHETPHHEGSPRTRASSTRLKVRRRRKGVEGTSGMASIVTHRYAVSKARRRGRRTRSATANTSRPDERATRATTGEQDAE